MRLVKSLIAVSVVGLAGCAQPGMVTNGVPTVVTNQGSEAAVSRTVAVAAGAKLKLQFFVAINPDCTVIPSTTPRSIKEPARGRLTIQTGDDFAYFPPTNPRSACNSKRVRGHLVEYQAPVGFKGTETLSYDVFNTMGGVFHHTITVNVM
jgi:hypothetical protein